MTTPVEVTTRYATTVDELADAWAFVMDRLDNVGPNPRITISPIWSYSPSEITDEDHEVPRRFEICVEGMVHEETP